MDNVQKGLWEHGAQSKLWADQKARVSYNLYTMPNGDAFLYALKFGEPGVLYKFISGQTKSGKPLSYSDVVVAASGTSSTPTTTATPASMPPKPKPKTPVAKAATGDSGKPTATISPSPSPAIPSVHANPTRDTDKFSLGPLIPETKVAAPAASSWHLSPTPALDKLTTNLPASPIRDTDKFSNISSSPGLPGSSGDRLTPSEKADYSAEQIKNALGQAFTTSGKSDKSAEEIRTGLSQAFTTSGKAENDAAQIRTGLAQAFTTPPKAENGDTSGPGIGDNVGDGGSGGRPEKTAPAVFSPTPGGTADQIEAKVIAKNEAAAAASRPAVTGGHFVDTEGERLNTVPAWHANPGWVPAGSGDAAVAGLNTDPSKGAYVLEQRPDKAVGNSTIFRMSDGTYKTYDPKVGLTDAGTWNSSEWNASKYASTTGNAVPPAAPEPVTGNNPHWGGTADSLERYIHSPDFKPLSSQELDKALHPPAATERPSYIKGATADQIEQNIHTPGWEMPLEDQKKIPNIPQSNGVTNPLPRHLSRPDEDLDPFGAFDSTPKGKSGP